MAGQLGVKTPGDPAIYPPVSDTGKNNLQASPGQRTRNCQMRRARGSNVQFPSATGLGKATEASSVHTSPICRTRESRTGIGKPSKTGTCIHCGTRHCVRRVPPAEYEGLVEIMSRFSRRVAGNVLNSSNNCRLTKEHQGSDCQIQRGSLKQL